VQAVVLVGGLGTRLRPLTASTPKQMLPVGDRPMLEWVMSRLREAGVTEAVLSLGYRPDAFARAYPEARCAGVALAYAVEPEPRGTAGAVRFAADAAGIDDTFLVVNGDVLTDLDLAGMAARHRSLGVEGTIALHRVDDPSAFGVVTLDGSGVVTGFVEKPDRGEAQSDLVNAGTYILEPTVLARIPAGVEVSIERSTFPAMVRDGALAGWPDDGYWRDMGTPSQLLAANLDVLDGKRGERVHAVVGDVDPAACVRRSVIGAGCRVDPGATVVDSVLQAGCVVGSGARVEGSLLGTGVVVGARAVVLGLSVLGDGQQVASAEVVDGMRRPDPA
jgi:mannose-1-phosphate guanylyltransferase